MSPPGSTTTRTHSLARRAATAGLAGAIALGGFGALSTALDDAPAAAAEQKASKNIVPINQFGHGNATEETDCGPTAVVSSMLAQGKKPAKWNDNNPGPAIAKCTDRGG